MEKETLENFQPKTEKETDDCVAKKHQITTLEIITERDKEEDKENCSRIAVLFSSRSLFSVVRLRVFALFVLL